jgi:hypothetical protein
MARRQDAMRPLSGYRDVAPRRPYTPDRRARSIILAFLIACYLTWTLVIFFLEPGLR